MIFQVFPPFIYNSPYSHPPPPPPQPPHCYWLIVHSWVLRYWPTTCRHFSRLVPFIWRLAKPLRNTYYIASMHKVLIHIYYHYTNVSMSLVCAAMWMSDRRKRPRVNLLWKMIFVRSRGAIAVFATAPATAPDMRELNISLNSVLISSSSPWRS